MDEVIQMDQNKMFIEEVEMGTRPVKRMFK